MNQTLIIQTDGGSRGNPGPAAVGIDARYPNATSPIFQGSFFIGTKTNNEAEYEAVLAALSWLQPYIQTNQQLIQVNWFLDSQLVVNQINGDWKVKDSRMKTLVERIKQQVTLTGIDHTFTAIPREKNAEADRLVNLALDAR